jgi:hypothetical protein
MVFGSGIRDPEKTHSGSRIRIRNTDKKTLSFVAVIGSGSEKNNSGSGSQQSENQDPDPH